MTKKQLVFVNRFNGDVKIVSKQSAKKLSEDYSKAEFVKNEKGTQVMRIHLEGATVDIAENEQPKEVLVDGKRNTK